jgi:hypothetical protein
MKRYSFKIIVAGLKEDVNRLFENNPSDVQRVISTINDPANNIASNMQTLAAWCMLDPNFTIQSIKYIIEHIVSEKLKYKVLLRDKTLVILSNSEEKPFKNPIDLGVYLDSQIRTTKKVSTQSDIEPIMQSPDGKIKIFKVSGDYAPAVAATLGSDTDWCITKPYSGMYHSYRFSRGSTFYFVFDENMAGTSLEKVAIDFPKFTFDPVLGVFPVKRVDLTDLTNRTGPNLTQKIPGVKGKNWNAYQAYLRNNGIDTQERDENNQLKLRNEPITSQEKEEHELLKTRRETLDEFLELLKGENLREDLAKKYLARGHYLTTEQFDWLVNNQNQITLELLSQYISYDLITDWEVAEIKKIPKLLKRLKGIAISLMEQKGYLDEKYKSIFTTDELRELYPLQTFESLSFFPEGVLSEEEIISEFNKDPEKFTQMIMSKRRFDFITPEVREKILQLSQTKGINLLLMPYELFFPNPTMSELAAYISKFPDCILGDTTLPLGVLFNSKFIRLLLSYGFTGWYKMFTQPSNLARRVTYLESNLALIFRQDIDLISHFPKSEIKKLHYFEDLLVHNAPDLVQAILANPKYANRFNLKKLKSEKSTYMPLIAPLPTIEGLEKRDGTKIEEGELPEVTPEETQENQNPMVGLMKKLDDSGMYGVADKVQNLWKSTVDKTKESLDKLS